MCRFLVTAVAVVVGLVSMACASTETEVATTTTQPATSTTTTLPRSAACEHLHDLAEQQRTDWDRAADELDAVGANVDPRDLLAPFVRLRHATERISEIAVVWGDTCMGSNDDDDLYGIDLRLEVPLRSGYLSNWCTLIKNRGLTDLCPQS